MLLILYLTILIVFVGNAASFFGSDTNGIILSILQLPSMYLFYKNLVICFKKDTIEKRVQLVLLNLLYNPFYSIRVFKKGWLND